MSVSEQPFPSRVFKTSSSIFWVRLFIFLPYVICKQMTQNYCKSLLIYEEKF